MNPRLELVSHALCPYVQRVAIVLHEKGLAHTRRDVDLNAKPAWFLALSPLGKTPLLCVDEAVLFESAVICEYLDDRHPPRLHPADALARARERSFVELGSALLADVAAFYNASTPAALAAATERLARHLDALEQACAGPWFAGPRFGLVDAACAPLFRYFEVMEALPPLAALLREQGLLASARPRLQAWQAALAARPSVRAAVAADYPARLRQFLAARPSLLGQRLREGR